MAGALDKTGQNEPISSLSAKQIKAAVLVAEDELTDEAIAQACGIARQTLATWKNRPAFQTAVAKHVDAAAAALSKFPIARRDKRVAAKNRRWLGLQSIVDERAAESYSTPGGQTGLLVKQTTYAKNGDVTVEFVTDSPLMTELRALEKEAAQEAGQWSEKREVSGSLVVREYVGVPIEDV